jgi:hypothetical protein
MEASRDQDGLCVAFTLAEGRLLLRVLESVRANYQVKPAALDAKAASVWYSTRGCQAAGMTPAETRDWMENLFQYRSENVGAITGWIKQLSRKGQHRHQLLLPWEEAPQFLTVLNDHRLLQAARHDLGEQELRLGVLGALKKLSPMRQAALWEVELLGYVIELILVSLPNSGADWRTSCSTPEAG